MYVSLLLRIMMGRLNINDGNKQDLAHVGFTILMGVFHASFRQKESRILYDPAKKCLWIILSARLLKLPSFTFCQSLDGEVKQLHAVRPPHEIPLKPRWLTAHARTWVCATPNVVSNICRRLRLCLWRQQQWPSPLQHTYCGASMKWEDKSTET